MKTIEKIGLWFAAAVLVSCSVQPAVQRAPASADRDRDLLGEFLQKLDTEPVPPVFQQPALPIAQTGFPGNPNVQAFIRYQQQYNGLDAAYLESFFSRAAYRPNIIDIMNRPGTARPWYEFQKGNAGSAKIQAGRRFYQNNRAAIDSAAARYGVPAAVITAIIGIETNYGSYMGNVRTGDALATLAFDYPRRAAFFQKELAEFLQLAREEQTDPFDFSGSYAGAVGMPQFMPSSIRKWAVDADGDGHRNIWRSVPDVAASVANYLKMHGWQNGGRMIVPVSVAETPQILAVIDEKTALSRSVRQLREMGVSPLQAVDDNEKAVLFRLETSPGRYDYYIGLNNFYAVWQYNHSRMYVTAVRDIANGIGADL